MKLDIRLHFDPGFERIAHAFMEKLNSIEEKENHIMADLDAVLADVADESTKIDSLATLMAGLKQQLADALAGVTISPAVQAKIDAVFSAVDANKAKVQAALDANVPPAPPVPAPVP